MLRTARWSYRRFCIRPRCRSARRSVAQRERFWELIAGVQIEHRRPRLDLGQPVNNDAAFGTEGRGHRQLGKIVLNRPSDDLGGRRRFQLRLCSCSCSRNSAGGRARAAVAPRGRPASARTWRPAWIPPVQVCSCSRSWEQQAEIQGESRGNGQSYECCLTKSTIRGIPG